MSKLNITYVESNIDDDTVESCTFFLDKSEELYCIRSFDNSPSVSTITPTEMAIVPAKLARLHQWVNWRATTRDGKSTKKPTQPNGTPAKSNDSHTWHTWHDVVNAANRHDGIGFVFSADDDFVGIDLDGCRNPTTGILEPWASEIVERFPNAYIEVSPSKTGVKIFCLSDIQFEQGLKYDVPQPNKYGKQPAIEIYSQKRFFTITGEALPMRQGLGDCTDSVRWLRDEVQVKKDAQKSKKLEPMPYSQTWSDAPTDSRVIDRARAYVARMPPAISGQRGSDAAYDVALALCNGFALDERDAWQLLLEYNQVCQPPWSEHELRHKLADAQKQGATSGRGYLLDGGGDGFDGVHRSQHTDRQITASPASKPPEKRVLPPIRQVGELLVQFPRMRPAIVDGLFRQGETCNIIAAAKAGKSFLAIGLAYAIATGQDWLGYPTKQGRVLIVDNELHEETLSQRLRNVAESLEVDTDFIEIESISLRGQLLTLDAMHLLFDNIEPGKYDLIVFDALYRMLPKNTVENDNAAVTGLYNMIDGYAKQSGAAIVVIHHASKGNQSDKSVTDVGAGAGAISRAADSHLTIRPHDEDGLAVLEGVTRSFPSPSPKTIRYEYPVWQVVDEIKPIVGNPAVKAFKARTEQKRVEGERVDIDAIDKILATIPPKGINYTQLRIRAGVGGNSRFDKLMGLAESKFKVLTIRNRKKKGGKRTYRWVSKRFVTVGASHGNSGPIPENQPGSQPESQPAFWAG